MSIEQLRGPRPGPAVELYFTSAANNLVAAARTLEEIRLEGADPRAVRVRLSAFERVSHQLTEQLVRLLVAEQFAVPDRTELYRAGSRIDYAVDHLESVGRMIEIHCLTVFPDELLHLIRLAADAAWSTAQGIARVRSPEAMPPYWLDLHRISDEADQTLRKLYARHFGTDCPVGTAALRDVSTEIAEVAHLLDTSSRTMRGVVERWTRIE
ncbi:DUF47 domain-containing protein [Nocardia sp. NPDC059240]|uniref:DUF47 domain-containing protein n=1 Tax=Nocardia sp. NPDC059240 TaxID=3346786 RepID=UPI0036A1FEAB